MLIILLSHMIGFYIGCNLAGYTLEEIAPLFKNCLNINNIILPEKFYNIIKNI